MTDAVSGLGNAVITPIHPMKLTAPILPTQDPGSILVIILKGETKACDNNVNNLKWVFSDPYFTIQVVAVEPPPNIPPNTPLTEQEYISNYTMRKALTYAAEGPYVANSSGVLEPQFAWTNLPCIIVKDSSVSNITPSGITNVEHTDPADDVIGGMQNRIEVALARAPQADLYFLCHWLDACNRLTDVTGVGSIDHGSTLKWSVQPTATQAIMYKPASRDYIREALISATVPLTSLLNTYVGQGTLLAVVFVPNIIDFDINLATNNNDYLKLNECDRVTTTSTTSSTSDGLIWFAVITALIILVAWALISIGPRYA